MKTLYKRKSLQPYQEVFFCIFCTIILIVLSSYSTPKKLQVEKVLVESRENPMGINTLTPSFSWKLRSDAHDVLQTGYRIAIGTQPDLSKEHVILWDSDWVQSDQSLYLIYKGKPLQAGRSYYMRVSVRDNYGHTAISSIQRFHIGLLQGADWGDAKWITKDLLPDSLVNPLPLSSSKLRIDKSYDLPVFRKSVHLRKKLKSSIAYIAGLGHYELLLNGKNVDDAVLQPGWTKYDKEAYYVVYDLTKDWKQGKNTLAVLLGNGFYYIPPIKGRFQKHKVAFGLPKLKMKIVNTFTDGTEEIVVTDTGWKTHRSPITFSSMYGGEDYDANILPDNWPSADYDDSTWQSAVLTDGPSLQAQEIDPVRIMQYFVPKRTMGLTDGKRTVYDFGQNASGITTLTMKGNRGDTVRVYPAELLTEEGLPNQKHSGSPYYYQYIFDRDGQVEWRPRFTYYGFRYAEVQLRPSSSKPIKIVTIKAAHIRNAARQIGTFRSSDTLFNQIHELINWAIKSNMVSVFTDCPHREKLGWLEQLHLMGPSVHFNFDVERLFAKSLRDMRNSQTETGLVPEIAPEYVQFDWGGDMFRDSPEWGSSSILLAWYAYQWYGNKAFLTDNYDMMKKYISYLQRKAKDNILYQGLGDWYDLGPERPGVSQLTPAGITGTAIYYYDLTVLTEIAGILGDDAGQVKFDSLRHEVYQAFNKTFYDAKKSSYGTGSQTALSMALYMGLVDEKAQEQVFANLVQDVVSHDTSFTAGDIGHRYLLKVLQAHKRDDLIFAMHQDDTRPGYGYQIRKGATALTESWAALPNVSNNHFMLGHLMEWFHAGLGGLGQVEGSIGYKHVRIAPRLLGDIARCSVGFETPYGQISWKGDKGVYQLEIPVNSTCTMVLPLSKQYSINGKSLATYNYKTIADAVEITLGSGIYTIK
ncbi:family 78 glycoside hydrolase catalytic domain [Sphingobacterium sp. LRF_L2]|uniref:family 78 glycoside hydrolase catalytic domain n=1 Tax=Sphingobacterium sp. LRF_L2 TaxID=3369421 RepID=UPI003F5E6B9C